MSLAIFLKNNIVIQTVHTVGLTEMWLIYAMSLLYGESFGTVQLSTTHKKVLPSRFLLLVFVDKTTAQPYPYAPREFVSVISLCVSPGGWLLSEFAGCP